MKSKNNAWILAVFGLVLFFLVLSVVYLIIFISGNLNLGSFQAYMPFIVFAGFFIFLIGAMLLALSIFRSISRFND